MIEDCLKFDPVTAPWSKGSIYVGPQNASTGRPGERYKTFHANAPVGVRTRTCMPTLCYMYTRARNNLEQLAFQRVNTLVVPATHMYMYMRVISSLSSLSGMDTCGVDM